MIKFDGYYIIDSILYQERKEHSPNYLNSAYSFNENNFVIKINRWSLKKENLLFSNEDFKENFGEYFYKMDQKKMYICDKNDIDSYKFYYEIINENEIRNIDSGRIMKFVPWEKYK